MQDHRYQSKSDLCAVQCDCERTAWLLRLLNGRGKATHDRSVPELGAFEAQPPASILDHIHLITEIAVSEPLYSPVSLQRDDGQLLLERRALAYNSGERLHSLLRHCGGHTVTVLLLSASNDIHDHK